MRRSLAVLLAVPMLLVGCAPRAPMAQTLPPLVAERVSGAHDVEFREGATASPGLVSLDLSLELDREATSEDLGAVIDAILETNTASSVGQVDVRFFSEAESGDLDCVDLRSAIVGLGLPERTAFTRSGEDCASLLADLDDLQGWHDAQQEG